MQYYCFVHPSNPFGIENIAISYCLENLYKCTRVSFLSMDHRKDYVDGKQ